MWLISALRPQSCNKLHADRPLNLLEAPLKLRYFRKENSTLSNCMYSSAIKPHLPKTLQWYNNTFYSYGAFQSKTSKYFTISVYAQYPLWCTEGILSVFKWVRWCTEKLNNISKETQQVNGITLTTWNLYCNYSWPTHSHFTNMWTCLVPWGINSYDVISENTPIFCICTISENINVLYKRRVDFIILSLKIRRLRH